MSEKDKIITFLNDTVSRLIAVQMSHVGLAPNDKIDFIQTKNMKCANFEAVMCTN